MSFDDIDDLFAGGGKGPASLTVRDVNDVAGGIIFKMERLEERDDAGEVKVNERGKPKPLFVTWVITDKRDPMNDEDDGARRIWWKGNALWELQNFLRENGLGSPKLGGYIAMKLIGKKPSGKPQPMKLHAATYRIPTNETEAQARQFAAKWERAPKDDLFGDVPAARATTMDSMKKSSNFDNDEPPF